MIPEIEEALAAADRLAHQTLFSTWHDAYWKAREKLGPCTVCEPPSLRSSPEGGNLPLHDTQETPPPSP